MLFEYFKENIDDIILVSILILTVLVILSMLNVDFNPRVKRDFEETTIIEGLENKLAYSFCENNTPSQQENKCQKLNNNSCNSTNCCIWLSNNTCVAGNENGPVFLGKKIPTMDGINIADKKIYDGIQHGHYCNSIDGKKCFNLDYYYYKNKCIDGRGKCPENN